MTREFYNALQMDPSVLKRRIAACGTKGEKAFYWAAMAVRSALIVAVAILFISLLSGLFGADNTPLAVMLFCMLLGIRFVDFDYCIADSMAALGAALAILTLAPCAAAALAPVLVAPLHFIACFALLLLTCQRPEMGNGGIYNFAYIYLAGNPVAGQALARRGMMALAGYLLCGAILFVKHRKRNPDACFHHRLRRFDLARPECLWQLRMALGGEPGAGRGEGLWGGAVHMDGLCLRVAAVGISAASKRRRPLLAAHRGRGGGLRPVRPSLSGGAAGLSLAAGPAGRVLHGLLHRLPL